MHRPGQTKPLRTPSRPYDPFKDEYFGISSRPKSVEEKPLKILLNIERFISSVSPVVKSPAMESTNDGSNRFATLGHTPGIIKVLDIPHILQEVVDKLSVLDCVCLTATCKELASKKPQIWNINKHLLNYFPNPSEFRSLMAKHGAIVSGSDALQFLLRKRFKNTDIDICVHGEAALFDFARYFEAEGYVFEPSEKQMGMSLSTAIKLRRSEIDQDVASKLDKLIKTHPISDGEYLMALEGVFTFKHKKTAGLKVQLLATLSSPLESVLQGFYSTAIMNFYDWSTAYPIFPYHTFNQRESFMTTEGDSTRIKNCIQKYKNRGWETLSVGQRHFNECPKSGSCCGLLGHRRVGGCNSWILPLNIADVNAPDGPPSLIPWSTFNAKGSKGHEGEDSHITIECSEVQTASIQHTLLIDKHNFGWAAFLDRKVSGLQSGQINRLNPPGVAPQRMRMSVSIQNKRKVVGSEVSMEVDTVSAWY